MRFIHSATHLTNIRGILVPPEVGSQLGDFGIVILNELQEEGNDKPFTDKGTTYHPFVLGQARNQSILELN